MGSDNDNHDDDGRDKDSAQPGTRHNHVVRGGVFVFSQSVIFINARLEERVQK